MGTIMSQAQTEVHLGYCAGEVAEQGSISVDGKQWVSGAIYLPEDMLKPYAGCSITTLRAALATKINVDSLCIWIRTDLRGENIAEGLITTKTTPKLAKGWNDIDIETPYAITGNEGLYIGMSYRQKAEANVLSVVGSPLPNACFVKLGDDALWQDMSNTGILSVEAIATGDNLPDYDLGLSSAVARPTGDGELTELSVTVVNNGQKDVNGFTLSTKYENNDDTYTNHFDTQLAWGEKATFKYTIPSLSTVSNGDVVVSLSGIDDGEDQAEANNSIKARFALVKKVLIEEYTSEPCGNCPRVVGYLHNVMEMEKYAGRIVAVCHHSGYKADWLTLPCDEKLASYFGVGYNPAMMFDRRPMFDGSTYICPEQADIVNGVENCLEEEAHVSVNIIASFDEDTKKLNVTVSGSRQELAFSNPALTVYLLEDNVPHVRQTSAPKGFTHQHVIRAYNSFYGDDIVWNGNLYEMNYTFDVDDAWVKDNLSIAAFVNNYSSTRSNNTIDNAECVSFPVSTSDGISEAKTVAAGAEGVYSLDGRRQNQLQHGLNIVVREDGKVVKVIR